MTGLQFWSKFRITLPDSPLLFRIASSVATSSRLFIQTDLLTATEHAADLAANLTDSVDASVINPTEQHWKRLK